MELYFVRHGKTQWNQEMRFQGREGDSPLLPESYKRIKLLGQELQRIPFKKIYTSPSLRAQKTAKGIASELLQSLEIMEHSGLKELGLGKLEGAYIEEAKKQFPKELTALRDQPDQYDPVAFGGEDYQEMISRSTKVVLQAVAEEKEGPLLFVGHGATLTACIQTLAGVPLNQIRKRGGLENNTVSILKQTGETTFKLCKWNGLWL